MTFSTKIWSKSKVNLTVCLDHNAGMEIDQNKLVKDQLDDRSDGEHDTENEDRDHPASKADSRIESI